MAGHKAATVAPTWPDINGTFVPAKMFSSPALMNLIENKITIHFFHRSLAYILFVLILIWTWKAFKISGSNLFLKTRWIPLLLVSTQVILGIFSVLTSVKIVPNHWGIFEWTAQFHQLIAMSLLLSLFWTGYLIKSKWQLLWNNAGLILILNITKPPLLYLWKPGFADSYIHFLFNCCFCISENTRCYLFSGLFYSALSMALSCEPLAPILFI